MSKLIVYNVSQKFTSIVLKLFHVSTLYSRITINALKYIREPFFKLCNGMLVFMTCSTCLR
ncbi:hypothetical protein HanHA300_Chr05g0160001 [Helianthus annuus]|nr:hypothetical protein HanHA300_Chr05g0160001 [Helianthus annuus]KAJ0583186.1 hypothetical protein HanHA89_Chr05g0173791 [Helianthus annuus]KAJ0748913.1 hypothetical protein HanLR1_Chr05g0163861 [Helianthus annuus]